MAAGSLVFVVVNFGIVTRVVMVVRAVFTGVRMIMHMSISIVTMLMDMLVEMIMGMGMGVFVGVIHVPVRVFMGMFVRVFMPVNVFMFMSSFHAQLPLSLGFYALHGRC